MPQLFVSQLFFYRRLPQNYRTCSSGPVLGFPGTGAVRPAGE
jgi:hypothetical protein